MSASTKTTKGRSEPVRLDTDDGDPRLVLSGVVGIAQAEQLHEAARGLLERGRSIDVDCSDVEHLDTTALQILIALKAKLRTRGQDLQMTAIPDAVRRYLSLSGLEEVLRGAALGAGSEGSPVPSPNTSNRETPS